MMGNYRTDLLMPHMIQAARLEEARRRRLVQQARGAHPTQGQKLAASIGRALIQTGTSLLDASRRSSESARTSWRECLEPAGIGLREEALR